MKKTQTARRKQARKTVALVSLPPAVAVLATFIHDDGGRIDPGFLRVWQQMPALVAQMIAGNAYSDRGTTKDSVIEGAVARDIAEAMRTGNDDRKKQAQSIDTIRRSSDLWTDLYVTLGDAAFNTGLALGFYLLTNAAPVHANADGAR